MRLDDSLADAHFALGWTLASYDWNWSAAEQEYRRGLELNPGSSHGHSRFGWVLSWLGRDAEAMAEVGRAQQLNPTGPIEIQHAAAVHFVARRYDDAILAARRAIQIDSTYHVRLRSHGSAAIGKGTHAEGIAALEKAVQLSFRNMAIRERSAARMHSRDVANDARRMLEELLTRAAQLRKSDPNRDDLRRTRREARRSVGSKRATECMTATWFC